MMETISSDILVVGAGLAGFTAAVRACEQGVKVLLIEKSNGELGDGNVLMASGSLRAGGKSPKTNPAELYEFVIAEGVAYPQLAKAWSDTCGRAVDWLISAGVKVTENAPGRIWLEQSGEVSLAPVYKKNVGSRALTSLKKRLEQVGGRYLNGVEGFSSSSRTVAFVVSSATNVAKKSNCAAAQRSYPPAASAPTKRWSNVTSGPTPIGASCEARSRTRAMVSGWLSQSAPRQST
jgi:hypothetical protein